MMPLLLALTSAIPGTSAAQRGRKPRLYTIEQFMNTTAMFGASF